MTKEFDYDVVVVGAGVVGPAIATAMARAGRKVCIIERNWKRPDRIVGELLQPSGVKALVELGLAQTINNIDAIPCEGYWIQYFGQSLRLDYITKTEAYNASPIKPVNDCVFNDNDKVLTDKNIDAKAWYDDDLVRGVSFHNGDFLMNLRAVIKSEKNITCLTGNVFELTEEDDIVTGVKVRQEDTTKTISSKLVIACDGIFSKLRKVVNPSPPKVESYFVGLDLHNCDFPLYKFGHVILGNHAPVLAYQTSSTEARMLCAYRSSTLPNSKDIKKYLTEEVLPCLPKPILPSFEQALEAGKFKPMPNQYLPAVKQGNKPGLVLLGDSLNMRHPLTGGGMTVGLNDAVLLARLLHPSKIEDLSDYPKISKKLSKFHNERKKLSSVINTLSMALYSLFAAESTPLKILQNGCFQYFMRGGDCITGPIGLLSGMLPFPMLLFSHFFSVAFYAIYLNFAAHGVIGFPVALWEMIYTFIIAVKVFVPYLYHELFR
ncbi:squalene monooxygenase [[Candida] jaroonii]|uniref:Squalene monooxygenase n=1 Tax=[Candida] jaroonii TaxID=467808 RepID=A0ACA9Y7P3_9ASCO|nr:squalene monooxygenase [[Candida] jaroonii]